MTPEAIHSRLRERFEQGIGDLNTDSFETWFSVTPALWPEVAAALKYDHELLFDSLMCIAGIDYPEESLIRSVNLLYSYTHRHRICVKVEVPRDNPKIPTVEHIWKHADWMEREAYDLLGLQFEGHPDLRRVLLPDDWVGHPLRKDYQEPDEYRGIVTWREDLRGQDVE